jgi:hypothetical protein
MNFFSAYIWKKKQAGGPTIPLSESGFVRRGNLLYSGSQDSQLRVPTDGGELNIGFVENNGRYSAVLLDDNGSVVRPQGGSNLKDITEPLQNLTQPQLEAYLGKAYASRLQTEKIRAAINAASKK